MTWAGYNQQSDSARANAERLARKYGGAVAEDGTRYVHIDELPYYLPPIKEIHEDNRIKMAAVAELDRILFSEHKRAMRKFPQYRDAINERPKDRRDIIGLCFQKSRFERQSVIRHRQIWAFLRADEESKKVRRSPAGVGAFKK